MYARLQEQIPDYYTEEQKEYLLRHPKLAHVVEEYIQNSRHYQVPVCHVNAIKQCDNQYPANIVHHSERRQKYLQAQRHTLTQQAEHSQRKSDVRSHRNSHAGRQFAYQQFTFYLQPHCQKENSHQAVVYELYHLQRMPAVREQIEIPDAQVKFLKQKVLVYRR